MPLISIGKSEYGPDGFKALLRRRCKAAGYTVVAEQTGLARETLYRSLAENGNPRLDTLIALCRAFDIALVVRTAKA